MDETSTDEALAAVTDLNVALRRIIGRLHEAESDQLGPMFADLDKIKLLAETLRAELLEELLFRG
jgi:hypothetical protein